MSYGLPRFARNDIGGMDMILARYVAIVSLLYIAAFAGIVWSSGGLQGRLGFGELIMLLFVLVAVTALGTISVQQIQKPNDPPFLLASILHGAVLLLMLLGWATT
jgi:hypothetical protein